MIDLKKKTIVTGPSSAILRIRELAYSGIHTPLYGINVLNHSMYEITVELADSELFNGKLKDSEFVLLYKYNTQRFMSFVAAIPEYCVVGYNLNHEELFLIKGTNKEKVMGDVEKALKSLSIFPERINYYISINNGQSSNLVKMKEGKNVSDFPLIVNCQKLSFD